MPANLTPQYHKAEEEFRRASTPEEELHCLQIMLREIPKHKGTDKLQAELKQKISKAKKDTEQAAGRSGARGGVPRIPRQGAGRAVIIGGPNAGKSQLLKSLTRATPEVAPYPFTTQHATPGMMPFEDVQVQLIDTPPITADLFDPATQGLIRGAELVLFLVDLGDDDGIDYARQVQEKLNSTKTRLGTESYLAEDDIGLSFTQSFLLANKIDLPDAGERLVLLHEFCPLPFREFVISGQDPATLDDLRRVIYLSLDVVRVYTKLPTKKEPDMERPFTLRRGGTLADLAELIHKDVARNLKYARAWGEHIHPGSTVKADYVLHDRDIVEIHD